MDEDKYISVSHWGYYPTQEEEKPSGPIFDVVDKNCFRPIKYPNLRIAAHMLLDEFA